MKGSIDAEEMKKIITTPIENGGSENELTVYQIVAEPADRILWIKTVESEQWAEVKSERLPEALNNARETGSSP